MIFFVTTIAKGNIFCAFGMEIYCESFKFISVANASSYVFSAIDQAFIQNTGSPYQMSRERHKWKISMRLNTKAGKDGG